MNRWIVRALWLIGVTILTVAIVTGILEHHQYAEYMKWNISNGQPGK